MEVPFKQRWWQRQLKRNPKTEFALLQISSLLLQLFYFVKCWRYFQELNSKGLYLRSQKEKENSCHVFLSSIKREVRKISRRSCAVTAKKSTKKRDARAKMLFCQCCRSRCRRRHRWLISSLFRSCVTVVRHGTMRYSQFPRKWPRFEEYCKPVKQEIWLMPPTNNHEEWR